ncbi:HEPACAM family member 2, partial [Charadrius vociferus]
GGNLAVLVDVRQELVHGTRGQSALLPVSYRFGGAPQFPVTIRWVFSNSSHTLIICTVQNCSLGAGGALSNCSAKFFPHSVYGGRAELFPENGSLLLRDLRFSDSGVYVVT